MNESWPVAHEPSVCQGGMLQMVIRSRDRVRALSRGSVRMLSARTYGRSRRRCSDVT